MAFVFGPVPSRRLGLSLGIDTVPLKTCNWNCIYCQLGRSTPVVHERREYLPTDAILAEVIQSLHSQRQTNIDWITFVGSGEGTLHSRIGELIRAVKKLSDRPLAVITNGSTLPLSEVREDMAVADAVMPTLDAGTAELYRRINRPHPSLTFERHVAGIMAFARMRRHAKLWIEVMLLGGINDTEPALRKLAEVLGEISPDAVHLTLPTRCPAENWVRLPDAESLIRAQAILGPTARLASTYELALAFNRESSLEEQICNIVSRHPLRRDDIEQAAQVAGSQGVDSTLQRLCVAGRLQIIRRFGVDFVCGAGVRAGERK
jgi:wyosine [tRNA(Phe)-imidazoG37] synthetase (radical SAM superfamily)